MRSELKPTSMRKIICIAVLALLAVVPAVAQSNRSEIRTGKVRSVILGAEKEYSVYLPAGYADSDRQYPVLYLLHGASDTHNAWLYKGNLQKIADRLTREGMMLPMIVVMPDARGTGPDMMGQNMGYFDQPGWEYEKHFFEEFIPHIEQTFRVRPGKQFRAIGGNSMGGGGAMVYALHRPDMFSSCCPLSGLLGRLHAGGNETGLVPDREVEDSGDSDNAIEIVHYAGESLVRRLQTVRWYIDCGDDDYLYRDNVQMYLSMNSKNIPVQFRMRDGEHDWDYWQGSLPDVLTFVSIGFAQ